MRARAVPVWGIGTAPPYPCGKWHRAPLRRSEVPKTKEVIAFDPRAKCQLGKKSGTEVGIDPPKRALHWRNETTVYHHKPRNL